MVTTMYELWMGTFTDSGGQKIANTEALPLHRPAPLGMDGATWSKLQPSCARPSAQDAGTTGWGHFWVNIFDFRKLAFLR